MKTFFLVYTIIILSLYGKSQDTLTIYYDKSWNKTSIDNSSFYRKAFKETRKKWIVTDYYKDGTIQMKGQYICRRMKKKNGKFIYFYKNGEKKTENNYVNNIKMGLYQEWFDDGVIKLQGKYTNNDKDGMWVSYFRNSQIREKGNYQQGKKMGEWNSFFINGQINTSGSFQEGKRIGKWSWFFENGQIGAQEIYKNGDMISANYWNSTGEVADSSQANKKSIFPGGLNKLLLFLSENTKYPKVAQRNNIQGRVFVQFVVNKKGNVTNVKILKGVNPDLDAEALRVVKLMPNWIPAKQHNRLVKISYVVPIKFKLFR